MPYRFWSFCRWSFLHLCPTKLHTTTSYSGFLFEELSWAYLLLFFSVLRLQIHILSLWTESLLVTSLSSMLAPVPYWEAYDKTVPSPRRILCLCLVESCRLLHSHSSHTENIRSGDIINRWLPSRRRVRRLVWDQVFSKDATMEY